MSRETQYCNIVRLIDRHIDTLNIVKEYFLTERRRRYVAVSETIDKLFFLFFPNLYAPFIFQRKVWLLFVI